MGKIMALAGLVACIAGGCATAPKAAPKNVGYSANGAVSSEIVYQPSTERYELRAGQSYLRELPRRENSQPSYPGTLLSKQLGPATVVARLVVNSEGAVVRANIVPPFTEHPEFAEAVLNAVSAWQFIPLKRVINGKLESLPFTQDYKFTFSQVSGRAVVTEGAGHER